MNAINKEEVHALWAGMAPKSLTALMKSILPGDEARKLAQQTQTAVTDAVNTMWRLVNDRRNINKPPETPALSLREKAQRLHDWGVLKYSMHEFLRFDRIRRKNIVAKRMRDLQLDGHHVPAEYPGPRPAIQIN